MPVPINADWKLAQTLYCQDVKVVDIAKQIGVKLATLKTRINRENWIQTKRNAETVVKAKIAETALQSLPELSKRVRQTLAEDCEETAQTLRGVKVTSLKDIAKLEETKLNATRRSALTFGWNDQTGKSIINVALINQVNDNPDMITDVNHSQVVDVETVENNIPSN